MRAISISLMLLMLVAACSGPGEKANKAATPVNGANTTVTEASTSVTEAMPDDAVLIASNMVTEVIVHPDPDGDPWETEKVEGYRGDEFINSIFSRIYDGTLTVYDYHSGESLDASDVRKIEKEYDDDRSKIGKLSFTEDWYYSPSSNSLQKRTKSVTFGYELYNNAGKVYAYRAAFRADLNE